MNKELIISVIIAVLLIVGGYFFVVNKNVEVSNENQQAQVSGGLNNPASEYAAMGDIDSDGKITAKDAARVYKAVSTGMKLNRERSSLADVIKDGVVNFYDADAILSYVVFGSFSQGGDIQRSLGDLDASGSVKSTDAAIVGRYIQGIIPGGLTPSQMIAADVDLDGKITLSDRDAIRYASVKTLKLPVLYGDVDGNGMICANDSSRVTRSLIAANGEVKSILPPTQKLRADIDKDGSVTSKDAELILTAAVASGSTCTSVK